MTSSHRTVDLIDDAHSQPGESRNGNRSANLNGEDRAAWLDRSRIVMSPIAAPSILGLFGFFAATIAVGSNIAGWWGNDTSSLTLFPFALVFGGVAQLLAGMWSYKARDGLATGIHGAWGSFWIGYGILELLYATGVETPLPLGSVNEAFAFWFIPLCAITITGALASLNESLGLFTVLGSLAGGAGIFAAGLWSGSLTTEHVAGWFFVISAAAAWYVGSALLLLGTTGRTILPLGKFSKAANVPLQKPIDPIEFTMGEPGLKVGQ